MVDDGSQARTGAIVAAVAQRDPRVRLLHSANRGVAAVRNLAIANARREYLAPLDADDIWYPHKRRKQVECLSGAGPAVELVYTWSVPIDEQGSLTGGCIASSVEGNAYLRLPSNSSPHSNGNDPKGRARLPVDLMSGVAVHVVRARANGWLVPA